MKEHIYKLIGEIPSHKNNWKRSRSGGLYMSKREQFDSLLLQLKTQKKTETLKSIQQVKIYIFGSNRKDAINEAGCIFDLLEKAEIIKNDRMIKHFWVTKWIDNNNPHAEVVIHT